MPFDFDTEARLAALERTDAFDTSEMITFAVTSVSSTSLPKYDEFRPRTIWTLSQAFYLGI